MLLYNTVEKWIKFQSALISSLKIKIVNALFKHKILLRTMWITLCYPHSMCINVKEQ